MDSVIGFFKRKPNPEQVALPGSVTQTTFDADFTAEPQETKPEELTEEQRYRVSVMITTPCVNCQHQRACHINDKACNYLFTASVEDPTIYLQDDKYDDRKRTNRLLDRVATQTKCICVAYAPDMNYVERKMAEYEARIRKMAEDAAREAFIATLSPEDQDRARHAGVYKALEANRQQRTPPHPGF